MMAKQASTDKCGLKKSSIVPSIKRKSLTTSNSLTIISQLGKKANGQKDKGSVTYELAGCKKNSLLREMLKALNETTALSNLYDLRKCINECLIPQKKSITILKKNVEDISSKEIICLFTLIDNWIETLPIVGKYFRSVLIRNLFNKVKKPLKNGDKIRYLAYSCRFKRNNKTPRSILSESVDPSFEDPELAAPISKLRFTSEKDLQEKMLRHVKARNARFENTYLKTIEEYMQWRNFIIKLKSKPLPKKIKIIIPKITSNSYAAKKLFKNVSLEERLKIYLYIIEYYDLYKTGMVLKFKNNVRQINGSNNKEFLNAFPLIKKYRTKPSSIYAALLSDYYLPPYVSYAIQRLFQLWFGYNNDTVVQIKSCDIKANKNERYITLSPIKEKTNDQQNRTIDRKNESVRANVIDLILEHDKNVSRYHKRDVSNIFVGITMAARKMVLPLQGQLHIRYLNEHNLPLHTVEQIRDQAICTKLIKDGDPYSAMRLAGHSSLQTLNNYVNQSIIRIANEANINEFQQQLGETIVWAVRSPEESEKKGIDISSVNKHLLFPVSDNSYEDKIPEVDDWIQSIKEDKNNKLILTIERIEWCLRQHSYYESRWEFLNRANSERFKSVHLPRILFTSALQQVIKDKQPKQYSLALNKIIGIKE